MEKYDIEKTCNTFSSLYVCQKDFQMKLLENGVYGNIGYISLPDDHIGLFSHHIQQMVSELGEVLEADKRWKKYRNNVYSREDKLEEVADCFLTMLNIAIFSGYQSWEVEEAIVNKMAENLDRIEHIEKMKISIEDGHKIAESWEVEDDG